MKLARAPEPEPSETRETTGGEAELSELLSRRNQGLTEHSWVGSSPPNSQSSFHL